MKLPSCHRDWCIDGNCYECKRLKEHSLQVVRTTETSKLPIRATPGSAGYDLFSAVDIFVPAHGKVIVPTGLKIRVPFGHYGRIAPRSGLTVKYFLDIGAGVIDPDYSQLVGVVMFNFSDDGYQVQTGDRVAQLIIEKISTPDVIEVESIDETQRTGGFGSTGV